MPVSSFFSRALEMTQLPVGIFVEKGFLLMEYFIENHFGVPFRRSRFSFSYHSPQTVFQNHAKFGETLSTTTAEIFPLQILFVSKNMC